MSAGLEALLPAGGVAAVLALVIGYLLTSNRADRRDYQDAVDRAERRADDEAGRHADTQHLLDEERQARRRAEDVAAEWARELADLRHEVERQSRRITEQTEQIAGLQAEVARLTGG